METTQENTVQPGKKKSKPASWKSIVGGDILATDFFRRQTKLLRGGFHVAAIFSQGDDHR